ncbi:RNA splicing factor [Lithospermum erythrorhizon]|uniref:RNA splicing factor n=1 Tax=Lithospermum erythrorhizon TaxID=34254 RepID=A0AAV3NUB7_LITER
MMRRSLSPVVRRELENLDKDADSRKSAMKVLKSYVKDLDSKAIPLFLAQVSETKESGFNGEYTISLYEVLARVHGTKIVSQIDNIMSTIIKTLSSSAGSFALHQACSKVVPAIARYGMDPTTPEEKKRCIIHSLCKPLSDCLLGGQESLSSGAALCLKALVECDNWRSASSEMVNEVCQRVVGALEKHTQTNSHMALVMALAKHNGLIVEAYARLLIHTAVNILHSGISERNSQKRLSAIHMLNTIMKCLDPKSIFSEVRLIIDEMEKFQADQMAYVSGAAFEALQTARLIRAEKNSRVERDTSSVTGSNYTRRENGKRYIMGSGSRSPRGASPESRTIDSFRGCDYFMDSPVSMNSINQSFQGLGYDNMSVNRKLWERHDNIDTEACLGDGILSEANHTCGASENESDRFSSRHLRSLTPSPQKSRDFDNVRIFTTPRKLMRSLQEPHDSTSRKSEKQTRSHRSPSSRKLDWSPTFKHEKTCHCSHLCTKDYDDGRSTDDEQFQTSTESVCSTEDICINPQIVPETISAHVTKPRIIQAGSWTTRTLLLGTVMVFFAVMIFLFHIDDQEVGCNLVPT